MKVIKMDGAHPGVRASVMKKKKIQKNEKNSKKKNSKNSKKKK